jgi:hypothetical protein
MENKSQLRGDVSKGRQQGSETQPRNSRAYVIDRKRAGDVPA